MRSFRNYIILFLGLGTALSALIVHFTGVPLLSPVGPRFNDSVDLTHQNYLTLHKPDLVLLGDSLVEENVDTTTLSTLLGQQIYPIAYPGSSSAAWYLTIKNNIATSAHKPETLILLFRDNMLTAPGYRVNGRYSELIEALATSDDSLVAQRSYIDLMHPVERWAEMYILPYHQRLAIRERMDWLLRYPLPRLLLSCKNPCVDASLTTVLEGKNMEQGILSEVVFSSASYLYSDTLLDFEQQLPRSYLPEIIRLGRENNMRLIFVRSKTLLFPNQASEPSGLDAYMTDLSEYLRTNGAIYLDLEEGQEIPDRYFVDLVHVRPDGKIPYTEALAALLAPFFQQP